MLHKFDQLTQDSKLELELDRVEDNLESLLPDEVTPVFDCEKPDIQDHDQDVDGEKLPHKPSLVAESRPEDIQCRPYI